jgi:hypothetical protein
MLLLVLLAVGAIAPVVVAALTIFFGTPRVPHGGTWGMAGAMAKGLALGAVGGLIVCAIVIGLALILRAVRG